jgi:lysophospholipase L1-like esterase
MPGKVGAVALLVAATSTLFGCAAAESSEPSLVGVIAIGHSGLTGENADPARQGQEARDQSWATGDAEVVDSIYLRMVAEDAAHEGNVANTASAGAASSSLAAQAEAALEQIPLPALAIIQTIDGDIRCDGTDAEHVAEFGENVRTAIEAVIASSPATRVLVVSQRGLPTDFATAFPEAPTAPAPGEESCEFVNASGEYVPANAEYLTGIIKAYQDEQARVCADFPTCVDDGAINNTFAETEDDLAGGDGNHLTTAGQARTAALIWPVVAETLGY